LQWTKQRQWDSAFDADDDMQLERVVGKKDEITDGFNHMLSQTVMTFPNHAVTVCDRIRPTVFRPVQTKEDFLRCRFSTSSGRNLLRRNFRTLEINLRTQFASSRNEKK